MVSIFAPNAFGNSRYGDYWGDSNNNEDATAFVGGAAILAALLAFLPARRRFREERIFLALAPLSLLIAVRIPGMPLLLSNLPVLNQSVSSNRRMLLLVAFSFAWLGACTVERWRTGEGPRRGAVLLGGAILLGAIAWGYLLSAHIPELAALRWFWMGAQLAAVAGAAGLMAFGRGGKAAMAALCALVAVELLVIHRTANPSLPQSAYYPTTPLVHFLQENAGGSRIAGLANRMLPNANLVYDLADIRISDPLKPFSYVQAVGPVSASIRSTEHILTKAEHPIYQLLGVRWLVAPPRMSSIPGLRVAFRDHTGRVFERERVLPRLFLPESAESAGGKPWPSWLAENPDFAARALLVSTAGWTAARPADSALEIRAAPPPASKPAPTSSRNASSPPASTRTAAGASCPTAGFTPPLTANGPFVAAWLPAGEHRVELVYRAPGFMAGLGLAALALAGLAARFLSPLRR